MAKRKAARASAVAPKKLTRTQAIEKLAGALTDIFEDDDYQGVLWRIDEDDQDIIAALARSSANSVASAVSLATLLRRR